MKIFVAAAAEGSLSRAARKLGKSPASVSRAIALLEAHVGASLMHRTTRSARLSEAGECYAIACRRVLAELDEAELSAAGERSTPRGTLTITAPVAAGEEILRPVIDAFMDRFPDVSVHLNMQDRPVNLIDEGIDLALRIAHLSDSTLVSIPISEVRRVLAASPGYLSRRKRILQLADLEEHQVIAMTHFGMDFWSFPPASGCSTPRLVQFRPRFVVNSIRAAVGSAVHGRGVVRMFSYHLAQEVEDGTLQIILPEDEHPPLPVQLVSPQGRL